MYFSDDGQANYEHGSQEELLRQNQFLLEMVHQQRTVIGMLTFHINSLQAEVEKLERKSSK